MFLFSLSRSLRAKIQKSFSPEEAHPMKAGMAWAYTLSRLILGILIGTLGTTFLLNKKIVAQNATIQRCAQVSGQPVSQEGWDFAQNAIRMQHATIEQLNAELTRAKANPAAQMLAQTGHVMNEEQCRAWMGTMNPVTARPAADPPIPGSATVIFERTNRQVDVNLSLKFRGIPLANLPKFTVGPQGELIPHWVFSGIVTPLVAGDDAGAVYYFFYNGQWNGPYPPQNVLQAQ
jgi:hypothetical protein